MGALLFLQIARVINGQKIYRSQEDISQPTTDIILEQEQLLVDQEKVFRQKSGSKQTKPSLKNQFLGISGAKNFSAKKETRNQQFSKKNISIQQLRKQFQHLYTQKVLQLQQKNVIIKSLEQKIESQKIQITNSISNNEKLEKSNIEMKRLDELKVQECKLRSKMQDTDKEKIEDQRKIIYKLTEQKKKFLLNVQGVEERVANLKLIHKGLLLKQQQRKTQKNLRYENFFEMKLVQNRKQRLIFLQGLYQK